MFLRNEPGLELAGGTTSRSFVHAGFAPTGFAPTGFGRALVVPPQPSWLDTLARIDWAPDLGTQIGSRDWWRGLATCTALCAAAYLLSPGFGRTIVGAVPAPLHGSEWDEARAQGIAPLAWGADTGKRMAANDLVAPLAEAPERPTIELSATIGEGDRFASVLERAGVGGNDANRAADLVSQAVALGDIKSGTRINLTLGRRADKSVARPLEALALRARFDLALAIDRAGSGLVMTRQPIAIDDTPLRIQGLVGSSLYRSARAAGAPARVVEAYIKALATKLSIGRDIAAADSFDLIVDQQRAATGEVRLGQLTFAGIDQGAKRLQLVKWDGADGGGDNGGWFDANGQTERRGFMGMPVAGHITSTFGMRMHPLLGFMRMHKGMDIGAAYGSPIYAVLDGVVQVAGRAGGYGNFIKLAHGGGIASGYGHMSRFAVSQGQRVSRGQVIGYVGSTGMSTGPHLHWEVWKNGQAINPRSISFSSITALSGAKLRAFKARVASLLAVKVGAAR
ncbi:MAG: M23 family metallopeptidase [Pseudomonadota bacterium]|nr:M23 family metallopeptidase [Pseudomonadota bacterium]